jgi:hypothetical protein
MATRTFRPPARTEAPVSFLEVLHQMSPEERLAYRAGAFTRRERTIWAGNYPQEVPLVNGEYEWIALNAE